MKAIVMMIVVVGAFVMLGMVQAESRKNGKEKELGGGEHMKSARRVDESAASSPSPQSSSPSPTHFSPVPPPPPPTQGGKGLYAAGIVFIIISSIGIVILALFNHFYGPK